ncbi:NUDIX hydrolase [Paenibacillus spongiae]|uniref:NUDIX hydrolase n=1 Tax=Paenibacillus spongiae TaxID=2909671 RepID=A0ABY5S4J9_9BACL|nr:NUDIX hydrolase [Paenibacillus spongiae]UVI27495.1 NUDIX hydrolase [Paenibacillus spongiae]
MVQLSEFPVLAGPMNWGVITSQFTLEQVSNETLISNISMIPTVGDRYVMMKLDTGAWELAGGTLKPNEAYLDALRREIREELGADLKSYTIIGHFRCSSKADRPYLPHIPHPSFIRLVGYGEVTITGDPLNPPDGEKVVTVEVVTIHEAVRRFEQINRLDLAELYRLVHEIRMAV